MQDTVAYVQVSRDRWLRYRSPVEVIQTNTIAEVCSAFSSVEKAVDNGLYAAGYISYEAAPAFDSSLSVHETSGLPLLWFGLYESVEEISEPPSGNSDYSTGDWQTNTTENDYLASISKIKAYMEAGDTYQVNYTLRLNSSFQGDPYSLFDDLRKAQSGRNCAFLDIGDYAICSASPELFLAIDGESLKSCPMKGTAARGLTWDQDVQAEDNLRNSEKNRAENVMIVDMIRNDLGRIADPGSVEVTSSFDVERYPTVLQMTSTVRAKSNASICDIMKAMFPCSSITGAPKVRTMEVIKELESSPRGVYTGAIGCMAPGRKALFNVAIRTVVIDKNRDEAEYGVGGGVVWDSIGESEFSECLDKAKVLTAREPAFELLETILWTAKDGFGLLDEHLNRIKNSAKYFGIPINEVELTTELMEFSATMSCERCRVRLLVDQKGQINIESVEIPAPAEEEFFTLRLAHTPVDSSNRFLYHKTTNRKVYEDAKAGCGNCDDVVLFNERNEVTETTITNVVAVIDGRKITPPVKCGLLPGTMRGHLLKTGEIEEDIITLEQFKQADEIWLINSVRGWVRAQLLIN
jgi:para-aminobenzoate synthetase/4-amino-4-deoxychorismate lyase